MYYVSPKIQTQKFVPVLVAQTGVMITDVSLNPQDACPQFTVDKDLGSGQLSVAFEMSFSIENSCEGKFTASGEATANGNNISLDCGTLQAPSCDTTCRSTPNAPAEVCITSLVINGQTAEGLPFCETVDEKTADQLILTCQQL